MRIRPWLATGIVLLLASTVEAAGPTLKHETHWLFGHRCAVTFTPEGPQPWLVPNESFEVEGFAAVWSDPLDGTLLLYGDGRHVWRGSDHQRIHEGTPGAPPLQSGVIGPLAGTSAGKFFAFGYAASTPELPATPRYASFDLQGAHAEDFRVPTYGGAPNGFFASAASDWGSGIVVAWPTTRRPEQFFFGTEAVTVHGFGVGVGSTNTTPEQLDWDGPAVSQSWDGRDAVLVHLPGHVSIVRRVPVNFHSHWFQRATFDVLDADDTAGSVHHTLLSPDGMKLYVGVDNGTAGDRADILQIDLVSGERTLLGRALGVHSPSFALGGDGVIYVGSAQPNETIDVLGAIRAPNALGDAAEFEPAALPLVEGCDVRRGLVNFVTGGMRLLDTDRDGLFDVDDIDNDNDGIPDLLEAGAGFNDSDYDVLGVLAWNRRDASTCAVPGASTCHMLTAAIDPDHDGLPSPNDLDADGDGIPDLWECGGVALDVDGDGRVDGPIHGSGLAQAVSVNGTDSILRCDTDDDGIVNPLDLDSDNDGIPDRIEATGSTGPDSHQSGWSDNGRAATRVGIQRDTDGDGIPDWLDPTDDRIADGGLAEAGPDAGSGEPDDGGLEDAGDAGPLLDAGDAGPLSDAGDAGLEDAASAHRDGGSSSSGSGTDTPDAAAEPNDPALAAPDGAGCSCQTSSAAPPIVPALAAFLLALMMRRERRRIRTTAMVTALTLGALVACGSDDAAAPAPTDNDDATADGGPNDEDAPAAPIPSPDASDGHADGQVDAGEEPGTEDASPDAALDASPDAALDAAADAAPEPPAPGDLDPGQEPLFLTLGSSDDTWRAAGVDGLGRVIAAGYAQTGHGGVQVLARYTAAGELDPTYGEAGLRAAPRRDRYNGTRLAVASDGAAYLLDDDRVVRFDATGALDQTFPVLDAEGEVEQGASYTDIAAEPDGSFVVVAQSRSPDRSHVRRYSRQGIVDATWNPAALEGHVVSGVVGFWSTAGERHYGALIARASAHELVILDAQGDVEQSFGDNGRAPLADVLDGARLAKVEGGWGVCSMREDLNGRGNVHFHRIDEAGSPDESFGAGGLSVVQHRRERTCVLRSDMSAAAVTQDGKLRHFTSAGQPNEWAGPNGVVDMPQLAMALHVQPDDKLLVLGRTVDTKRDAWLTRVRRLGDPDTTFGGGAVPTINLAEADTEVVDAVRIANDQLLVSVVYKEGYLTHAAVLRFTVDGLDPTFGEGGIVHLSNPLPGVPLARLFVQPDGSVYVSGAFTGPSWARQGVWLDANGAIVTRVDPYGFNAEAAETTADGKTVVARASGSGVSLLRRLATGANDPTYWGGNSTYHTLASAHEAWLAGVFVAPDASILAAAGWSTYVLGEPTERGWAFLRVQPNGVADTSFGPSGWKVRSMGSFGHLARVRRGGDALWAFGSEGSAQHGTFVIAKLDARAEPVIAFGTEGYARGPALGRVEPVDYTFRDDGSFTGAGCVDGHAASVRWSPAGDLDASWGRGTGVAIVSLGEESCATRVIETSTSTYLTGRRSVDGVYDAFVARLTR